jgi:hypothetical protein
MSKRYLIEFIREQVGTMVFVNDAGFMGGLNIGKYSGETVSPQTLGLEDETEKETDGTSDDGQRRQNGTKRDSGRSVGRNTLSGEMRRANRINNPIR